MTSTEVRIAVARLRPSRARLGKAGHDPRAVYESKTSVKRGEAIVEFKLSWVRSGLEAGNRAFAQPFEDVRSFTL